MKTKASKLKHGPATLRSVWECGDLSPLFPLAGWPASEGASSARCFGERERAPQFDGDKSPAESGDKSPHSQAASAHWLAVFAILFLTVHLGHAQNFSLDWFTMDGGGGTSTGGVYSLSGTIGQPDANHTPMTGGNLSLVVGFWSLFAVQTPGAPRLTIRLNPQLPIATVSWPSPSAGFTLQQNADLNTTNWVTAPQAVSDNGTNRFILVSPPVGSRFYRLFKP